MGYVSNTGAKKAWGEPVSTDTYLTNRMFNHVLDGKIVVITNTNEIYLL